MIFQNLVLGFMLVLFGLHCFFFENGSKLTFEKRGVYFAFDNSYNVLFHSLLQNGLKVLQLITVSAPLAAKGMQ